MKSSLSSEMSSGFGKVDILEKKMLQKFGELEQNLTAREQISDQLVSKEEKVALFIILFEL